MADDRRPGASFRSVMPDDLEWVDHHATGPSRCWRITQNAPQFDDIDFFNRRITQAYAPAAGLLGRAIQGEVLLAALRHESGALVLGRGLRAARRTGS